jgi:hypothetical protein
MKERIKRGNKTGEKKKDRRIRSGREKIQIKIVIQTIMRWFNFILVCRTIFK